MNRLKPGNRKRSRAPLTFHVWDILYHGYRPVLDKPLAKRKDLLLHTVRATEVVQPTLTRETDGVAFFEAAVALGMEGVIAKHRESAYTPGTRSRKWVAVRERRSADAVIGGYTIGTGRQGFESLLLGIYHGKRLHYAGAVSGGFDREARAKVASLLPQLQSDSCPFSKGPRVGKLLYWCKPRLVAHVLFGELNDAGQFIFPKFAGLRHDLRASDCTMPLSKGAKRA
jgi:bifunctional non-homologous end joining protein LigD